MFRDLGPNWFAAVMGTGIVANAAAVLPLRLPGLRVFATVVWALAATTLIALILAWSVHWTCVTGTIALAARSQADVLRAASVVLFALLVAAWLVVAARTVAGCASGRLFKPMTAAVPRASAG